MGAFCHITPVLNDILDLCRFDLTYLTHPCQNFMGAFHHVTLNNTINIIQKRARHNADKRSFFDLIFVQSLFSLGFQNGCGGSYTPSGRVGVWEGDLVGWRDKAGHQRRLNGFQSISNPFLCAITDYECQDPLLNPCHLLFGVEPIFIHLSLIFIYTVRNPVIVRTSPVFIHLRIGGGVSNDAPHILTKQSPWKLCRFHVC